ncbi:hypothetical protein VPFG_00288 [Vibrio phage nt-1]|uniref:Uncharacterized protein n=1 Tax=Vibrio phage nt-1 TaxID=115992 RepID=R9TJL1_9CAUD|nr:hypothetical protein VPFG_00288 [Vibrio phage nt-1]AGN30287.1 hypothetical protein VPFG_00288 [Vibrio phage nt-1]
MKKTKITARVGMMSLVGVSGSFPYARGNYCSNTQGYYFVNLWAENLEHLINNGYLPDGQIEVLLFRDNKQQDYRYAYVIDERVPKEALHAPYFCGIATSVEVMRYHYQTPDDKCLCDTDDYSVLSAHSWDNKGRSVRHCPQCDTRFTIQTKRRNDVYRVQMFSEFSRGEWNLLYYKDGVFYTIPGNEPVAEEDIIKVDRTAVCTFGSGDDQRGAISLADFNFSGLIEKAVSDTVDGVTTYTVQK